MSINNGLTNTRMENIQDGDLIQYSSSQNGWQNVPSSGVGQTYTVQNIGGQVGEVFVSEAPVGTFNLRTIQGSNDVTVTNNANDIEIDSNVTGANVGIGQGQLFRDKTGSTLNIKSIIGGQDITVTNEASTITIASTLNLTEGSFLGFGLTNIVNCGISQVNAPDFIRMGDTVFVNFNVHVINLTIPSVFGFEMNLPIARTGNFTNTNQARGVATVTGVNNATANDHAGNSNSFAMGFCNSVTGTQRVRVQVAVSAIVSTTYVIHGNFSYQR